LLELNITTESLTPLVRERRIVIALTIIAVGIVLVLVLKRGVKCF